ncbi:MAG: ArnT family glycosyltransferase [Limimaricola soesokkakensis]|uniref:ArnT family glycosyltransferase n=1 Tax=Limimaricola soesokkakensis TaxID=1343159 RepID=UPI004058CC7D
MKADRHWIAAILLWAAAQVAWRFAQGPSLELDEAEAFYHARHLALGYNAQPPLYFWLQWAVFQVAGEGILALALLKNALLAMGGLALYAMLRRLRPPFEAGLAVMALGLLPQVLWEAQRALTHSVLAISLSLVILALADRVLRDPGRAGLGVWLAFGIAAGLGVISKWNVALLPAAIAVAALIRAEWRARISPTGALLAIAAASAAVAAPLWWVAGNLATASGSLHKLGIEATAPLLRAFEGLGSLAAAWLAFCGLVILVVVGIAIATRARPRWRPDEQARLMIAVMLTGAALLAVGLVAGGATEVKDRWLLPVALFAGPLVALWAIDRLGPSGQRRLGVGLAGLWTLAFALLPISGWVDPGYRGADFPGWAAEIEAAHPDLPIVTDSMWAAGNLSMMLPGRDVRLAADADERDGSRLLISEADEATALSQRLGRDATPQGRREIAHGDEIAIFRLAIGE